MWRFGRVRVLHDPLVCSVYDGGKPLASEP
jgi:hypothetical protein